MSDHVTLDHNPRRNYCKVVGDGRINACADVQGIGDYMTANLAWRPDVLVVVCRRCGTEVTAATSPEGWRSTLDPIVLPPAPLPSPSARGNELRAVVTSGLDGVRVTLAEGRPLKAREYADELAWDALDAIAAGCDDPAGLARDLAALRAEVSAAQR